MKKRKQLIYPKHIHRIPEEKISESKLKELEEIRIDMLKHGGSSIIEINKKRSMKLG